MYNLLIRNARAARPDGNNVEGKVAGDNGLIDPAGTTAAHNQVGGRPLTRLH